MKRTFAALIAALLLIALMACKRDVPPPAPPEPPLVVAPETPETPATPPTPIPEPTPAPTAPQEPDPGQVVVTAKEFSDSVEESVSYTVRTPEILTESASISQPMNTYYAALAGKIGDLAWGEVFETAMERHTILEVTADFSVVCNQDDRLSILRTVEVLDRNSGQVDKTLAAETFNLQNGGLITMDDLFSVPAAQYTPRITDAIGAMIDNDPYHSEHYYEQWQSLLVSTFDKTQFYVTPTHLWVFFQSGDLGPEAQTEFSLSWSSLTDVLA